MLASCRLADVGDFHPRLLWDDAVASAVSVSERLGTSSIVRYSFATEGLSGAPDNQLLLDVDLQPCSAARIARLERTYEPARIVELAAIAVAGIALYYGARREIVDVSARGSGADYRLDQTGAVLEIAGRSRRRDLETAYDEKRRRLLLRPDVAAYICIVEFETLGGRLAYVEERFK